MGMDNDTYAGIFICPEIQPIEGKDRIGFVEIGGSKVIVRKDSFKDGDKGLFIYVDSVLPVEMVEHYQLDRLKNGRVKAMKMSGITSQGLFLPLSYDAIPKDAPVHQNIAEQLNILHWKPEVKLYKGTTPHINSRNWPSWLDVMKVWNITRPDKTNVFEEGIDQVVVTEKIHGMNATYSYVQTYTDYFTQKEVEADFAVCSRKVNFKEDRPAALQNDDMAFQTNAFYSIADKYNLREKLKQYSEANNCDIVVRGELFGKGVQDLEYGMNEIDFRVFDIQISRGVYLDWINVAHVAEYLGLKTVPVLYEGTFEYDVIREISERKSSLCPTQIGEGVVIRSMTEQKIGNSDDRKMLKMMNPAYTTRDDSKEVAE